MIDAIADLIKQADAAIAAERFDDLMDFYTEDALLVVKPGLYARGKAQIRAAFVKIAAYFQNSVRPSQGNMVMLEAGDTVLVLSRTLLQADNQAQSAYSMDRRATYVFRRRGDRWLCAIDNSYGTSLLDEDGQTSIG
ncbi:MAG TPA: SgcJ/EcaC family oxidoreductase [Firmicutes bacterium]|nr:SgcJ/EcaC family oxidoreductase [Bacillota bacterium]